MTSNHHRRQRHDSIAAFTLPELLTVLAVLAILVALLLPALSQSKAMSLNSGCVSNLKRIGMATQQFANDHDDRLPGPAWIGQPFEMEDIDAESLPHYLQRYLKESPVNGRLMTFLCPAYERYAPRSPTHRERVSFIVNSDVDPQLKTVRPFGYPQRWGIAPKPPLKLSDLGSNGPPDKILAITDADKRNSPVNDNPWFAQLPDRIVHSHHRNELYFDWHVKARRVR